MKIDAKQVTPEQADCLLKFLKREVRLEEDDVNYPLAKSFFIAFKDYLRPLRSSKEETQYKQFKVFFNSYFYWSYSFQADLDKFLNFFLNVYSDTNKEEFYEKFNDFIFKHIEKYEAEHSEKDRSKMTIRHFYKFYKIDFNRFVDSICLFNDMEFEDMEDDKEYRQAKEQLVQELETLFIMEFDLRKIYNNIKYSLSLPRK